MGHCVIINHTDFPCAKLVAVVTSVTPERVTSKYLCSRTNMKECYTTRPATCTPVSDFGFEVRHNSTSYWCQPVGESSATYEDGKTRLWQEHGEGVHWPMKPAVLKLAKKAAD